MAYSPWHQQSSQLAFAAHELNTPLMLMKHYAELIKESKGHQKQKFAEAIETLSAELLQSSQFMLQSFSADTSSNGLGINIADTINERFELFMPLLKEKHISFENQVSPHLYSQVPASSFSIVFNNLIGNALKFTPKHGSITLKNHSRIIQVLDTAPAIVPSEQQLIFEAFQKAASAQSNSGFGLGLHICSEVIDNWGGKIWLKSYPEQGNQFSFTIPNP